MASTFRSTKLRQAAGIPARRRVLAALSAAGTLLLPLRPWAAVRATPPLTEGPFYPENFSRQPQPRLVRGAIEAQALLHLEGRVAAIDGHSVAGARVEIWQCDPQGSYHHSRDSRPEQRDPRFAGFGWTLSDAEGRYAFDTIRPVPYTGRTPHIHLAVQVQGRRRLVTQLFVDGDPGNARDALYRWLPEDARRLLTIELERSAGGSRARFDIVLG
ncbi:MAG: intradiol ring-cleavage dioxygenase [Burkholderiaceae bacterium]|nr:intradiol ring-cleavage dioxygenase [Burkholderiaceae bacterium]